MFCTVFACGRDWTQEEWRSKLLKDVQYTCKLVYIALSARRSAASTPSTCSAATGDAKPAPAPAADDLTERLKNVATVLSLARRVMMSGSWVEGYWDLSDLARGGSAALVTLKGLTVAVKTVSDVADDVRAALHRCEGGWRVSCAPTG